MADNKTSGISGIVLTQLLFGLFLTLVLIVSGNEPALSLFLGTLGGVAVGWFTTTTKTGPQSQTVASAEGIDAGLKYWLFFLLGFVVCGYKPPMSIFLGAMAGFGGGWTIAWWKSKEETRTQLPTETIEDVDGELLIDTSATKRRKRKQTRRYRRSRGPINFMFWRR